MRLPKETFVIYDDSQQKIDNLLGKELNRFFFRSKSIHGKKCVFILCWRRLSGYPCE